MKQKLTILAAALAIVLAAQAETLTFQLGGHDAAVILNNGKLLKYRASATIILSLPELPT